MDMATATLKPESQVRRLLATHWPVFLGLLLLIVPTLLSLAQQSWSNSDGIHGPIILATGIWLLFRSHAEQPWKPHAGSLALGGSAFVLSLLVYVFGRAFSFISLEVLGVLAALVALAYCYFGSAFVRRHWFPIVYLAFIIPMPGWMIDSMTAPLKTYVSLSATTLLELAGYPIVREGVTLYIAQYQLLVEDACAGLNSIISLSAVSLFYIYLLHNASWRYSLFLMAWIIPVAMFANLVRVILLVLITYYFGNAAAQGYLHSTAGLVTFASALIGIIAADALMTPIRKRLAGAKA